MLASNHAGPRVGPLRPDYIPPFLPYRKHLMMGFSPRASTCLAFCYVVFLSLVFSPVQACRAASTTLDFVSIAQTVEIIIPGELQSNQNIISLYRSSLAPPLQLLDTLPLLSERHIKQKLARSIPPPSLRKYALDFTKSVALWQQAEILQSPRIHLNLAGTTHGLEMIQTNPTWAFPSLPAILLEEVAGLVKTLGVFSRESSPTLMTSEAYHTFTSFLDQRYPDLMNKESSWVSLATQGQTERLQSRFDSYWDEFPHSTLEKDSSSRQYFTNRIEGILYAKIVHLSQQIQGRAEVMGRRAWKELSTWKESWSHQRGLLRLCGTWKWIIHNHQNHGDHKMTMTFPHPHVQDPSATLPAKIITIGDLVYFRWEFKGGIQEDSLLFSKKDMRLEGSFRNSTGPHGNVSGTKIQSCSPPARSD